MTNDEPRNASDSKKPMKKTKVLIVGRPEAGKTFMCDYVFSRKVSTNKDKRSASKTVNFSSPADPANRNEPGALTVTNASDVPKKPERVYVFHDRFVLYEWACGPKCGEAEARYLDFFEENKRKIFKRVAAVIYVFGVHHACLTSDFEWFARCAKALSEFSPSAALIVLVNKINEGGNAEDPNRERIFKEYKSRVEDVFVREKIFVNQPANETDRKFNYEIHALTVFESNMYTTWCQIVSRLLFYISSTGRAKSTKAEFESALNDFRIACDCNDIIVFDKRTLLELARSEHKHNNEGVTRYAVSSLLKHNESVNSETISIFYKQFGSLNLNINPERKLLVSKSEQPQSSGSESSHFINMVDARQVEYRDTLGKIISKPVLTCFGSFTRNTCIYFRSESPYITDHTLKYNIDAAKSYFEELVSVESNVGTT